jgi:hypothetical protein
MSVKADNGFGISFGGNASGFVNIISNAPVTISGAINNPTGATDITATGSITETATTLAGAQQSVITNSLNLNATGGIGSAAVPFGVTFNSNPVLTAQAGKQGLYLNIAGDSPVKLGQISSGNSSTGYGPVSVIATGSLNPLTSATVVQGDTITLDSTDGGIGNISALTIKPMISGAAGSGTVNIEALGDINIVSNGTNLTTGNPGDLLIGSKPGILSQAGNVTVNVPNGAVLDASNETAGGALSTSQLQTIWGNLHLQTDNKQVGGAAKLRVDRRGLSECRPGDDHE